MRCERKEDIAQVKEAVVTSVTIMRDQVVALVTAYWNDAPPLCHVLGHV